MASTWPRVYSPRPRHRFWSTILVHEKTILGPVSAASMAVGVLALQGSYHEHLIALRKLGVNAMEVRKPEQLQGLSGLIIPGGESTTMAKLAQQYNLLPALREFTSTGKPVWGTCAGLIFLADRAVGQKQGGQALLGGLDCTVHRNFFGSQVNSFESLIPVPELATSEGGPSSYRAVFIRAPAVVECGPSVHELASCDVSFFGPSTDHEVKDQHKVVVAVRQGNILGTAFHPELTSDTRWHSYFLKLVQESSSRNNSTDSIESGMERLKMQQHQEWGDSAIKDLPVFES